MAKPFKVKKGNLVARLSGQERRVLEFVCDELTLILADPAADPDMPAWAKELGLAGVGVSLARRPRIRSWRGCCPTPTPIRSEQRSSAG